MMCDNCQQRMANVHFTQIVNNKKIEMHLCKQCAKEKGQLNMGPTIDINDFLTGLIGLGYNAQYVDSNPQYMTCKSCGMSYEEFQKVGKLGCSHCYEMYGEGLKPLLKRIHGSTEHHGKLPGKISKTRQTSKEIENLKETLNKAIQNEEYEKAAEIRDKIKCLEAEK